MISILVVSCLSFIVFLKKIDLSFLSDKRPHQTEFLSIRDENFRNDDFRIRSALSYLCHLTNLIALICDINLPKIICFRFVRVS